MSSNTPLIARSKPANFNWEDPFIVEDQLTEEGGGGREDGEGRRGWWCKRRQEEEGAEEGEQANIL